jgi:hypothetical protein
MRHMIESDTHKNHAPVDVEAIVADIRRKVQSVEPKEEAAVVVEPRMDDDLVAACNTFSGGQWPSGGVVALIRKAVFRMLGLKEFNGRIVAILSRIISVLNGTNVPESGTILGNQRRTINMLNQFSRRLDQYDDVKIAERLAALEEEIKRKRVPEKQ